MKKTTGRSRRYGLVVWGGTIGFSIVIAVFTIGCNAGQIASDTAGGAADIGRATGGFFADVGGFMFDNTIGHLVSDPNE